MLNKGGINMAIKTVMCATWNLELQCPDKYALNKSFSLNPHIMSAKYQPDIIAIGLQEASSYYKNRRYFVGDRLVENDLFSKGLPKNRYELVLIPTLF